MKKDYVCQEVFGHKMLGVVSICNAGFRLLPSRGIERTYLKLKKSGGAL
jgi:hypothetical protein